MSGGVSPVAAEVRAGPVATGEGEWTAEATITISDDEPVFAGHYSHFPIFPGICVLECVHRAALDAAPVPGLVLSGVKSARFTGAVYPGDVLTVQLRWEGSGGDWLCTARARTRRDEAATVRVRYREVTRDADHG
ncbi:3-hydroxyacyl-ACP dehydratase FabZ family protein [Amycolatopsis cihanbeyliensis]|uniref:3-hydroxyacyl-[acyl-carrier-protein] dehydratase n=1 Tax=Amycolatopsis cihanbeyliensis TaxID=1128664 RepID=A0A542DE90_AMYCI|nr:hypothetical protein [Amycolatopsis cihanbeyliensis]TQJ01356.1 3-hydroxyacyl-[acyl-carrier-protein] dehydratase [Amycolatopsis cihanbeyliensis]